MMTLLPIEVEHQKGSRCFPSTLYVDAAGAAQPVLLGARFARLQVLMDDLG